MSSNSSWTKQQNKVFEDALATFKKEAPGCWQNLARAVGGKTVEEVKSHYDKLVQDIDCIESGRVPLPNYRTYPRRDHTSSNEYNKMVDEQDQRLKYLKLQ